MVNCNIAVIGNGILALSTAFSLLSQDRNLKVYIFGSNVHTVSASMAAGAMLNHIAEVTDDSLKNIYGTQELELSISASKKWPEWLERINLSLSKDEALQQRYGTFILLNAKSGSLDTDNYLAIMKAADKYNEVYEEVNPIDIPGIDPIKSSRPLRSMYLPREGYIDPNLVLGGLRQALLEFPNVKFIDNNVNKVETCEASINFIVLDDGTKVYADKVLLAAGSYSQDIIDQIPEIASRIPRLLSGVGMAAVISQEGHNKIKHVIRTPNRSGACGLHAVPRGDSSLYIGATNNIAFSPSTKHKLGLMQFLLKCATDQVNQDLYNSEVLGWSVGNRPVALDTFPLMGKTSIENLYILTGTYRDGFQQSPFLADYMAKIMLDKEVELKTPFEPERKLLPTMLNKEVAINNAVKHYMSLFYEHEMKLASLFHERNLEQLLYNKFERIYEILDTDFPLTPDILFLFELSDENDKNMMYFKNYFKTQASNFK